MADEAAAAVPKGPVSVKHVDMPEDMQKVCIAAAAQASEEAKIEKDVATRIKKALDEQLTGTWHVVVGESYGCSVTHETKFIFFFKIGLVHYLMFRSLDDEDVEEL